MKILRSLLIASAGFFFVLTLSVNAQQENNFKITCTPFLENIHTNSVAVFWEVNKNSTGWVEYGMTSNLGSVERTFKDGMADVGAGIRKVMLTGLKPGTKYFYRTVSCEIKTLEPYKVVFGDTLKSSIYAFETPAANQKEFSFLAFNDIHDAPQYIEEVIKKEKEFNFAVFDGDILTDLNDETDFTRKIFSPLSTYFAAEKPIFLIRGNHETRGAAARNLYKYFDTPDGKFYYTFTCGNTFFIMLDCGEDKPDNNKYYFGLAGYDKYRSEEAKWLEKAVKSPEFKKAKFKIACLHMPINLNAGEDTEGGHGMYDCSKKFAPILNKAGIDLMLSGHTHKYEIIKPGKDTNRFPVIVGGAYYDAKNPARVAYTRVNIVKNRISVELKTLNGEIVDRIEVKK